MNLMMLVWIVVIGAALSSLLGLSALAFTFHYVNVVKPRHEAEEDDALVRELDFPIPVTHADPFADPFADPLAPRTVRVGPRDANLIYCPACLITLNQPIPGRGIPKLCSYHQRRIARRERIFA